jgi:hypothetical protein
MLPEPSEIPGRPPQVSGQGRLILLQAHPRIPFRGDLVGLPLEVGPDPSKILSPDAQEPANEPIPNASQSSAHGFQMLSQLGWPP